MKIRSPLFIIYIVFVGCSHPSKTLQGKNYTSQNLQLKCNDSLKFISDSTVYLYSCDVSWEYDCFYKMISDTIIVETNLAQMEVNFYDQHEFNFRMKLLNKGNFLEPLSFENKINGKWTNTIAEPFLPKWTQSNSP